ncbi:MAG: methyltransferase, partial [Bryobacteraceae bacterium]
MATGAPEAQPSPAIVFETLNSYQRTAALNTAIELDLFTAIADGGATAGAVATRTQSAERGVRTLCDYLTILGLLRKNGGEYSLTPDSAAFLNRRSPTYLGSITKFLLSDYNQDNFRRLTAAVREGGAPADRSSVQPNNAIWVDFARSMAPMMAFPAEMIAKIVAETGRPPVKVLDIAAGHGLFGLAIARHNPGAEITALDWAAVLEVAKENAARAGVSARYRTIPGSAFDADFGEGYDLVLLTNFLHHFDAATCETLLRKVHAALKPDGRVVTLEFVPNEDRVSPPVPAAFSMIMLTATPGGDAYT